jgi:hypothetical protein
MNLKETDELLEIWRNNDRYEWSDDAFDVVKEILNERDVDIPEQGDPIYERNEEEPDEVDREFSKEELEIIDDENPPTFYDPFDVLLLTKRLDWMIKAMIVFIVAYNIINFPNSRSIIQGFFIQNPNPALEFVVSALMALINAVLGIIVMYVPLKALTHILRILMEMEFRSRKAG